MYEKINALNTLSFVYDNISEHDYVVDDEIYCSSFISSIIITSVSLIESRREQTLRIQAFRNCWSDLIHFQFRTKT